MHDNDQRGKSQNQNHCYWVNSAQTTPESLTPKRLTVKNAVSKVSLVFDGEKIID